MHVSGTYLCQTFGIVILSIVHDTDSAQFLFKQEKQRADSHTCGCRMQNELEVHGRARREAARRRKSEWKVNLDIQNSSRSNGSWRMRNSILEPRGV